MPKNKRKSSSQTSLNTNNSSKGGKSAQKVGRPQKTLIGYMGEIFTFIETKNKYLCKHCPANKNLCKKKGIERHMKSNFHKVHTPHNEVQNS